MVRIKLVPALQLQTTTICCSGTVGPVLGVLQARLVCCWDGLVSTLTREYATLILRNLPQTHIFKKKYIRVSFCIPVPIEVDKLRQPCLRYATLLAMHCYYRGKIS